MSDTRSEPVEAERWGGGWAHPRVAWARSSTAIRLLILLTLALLPLGLIAIFASIDAAKTGREARVDAVELSAEKSAETLTSSLTRSAASLRAAGTALSLNRAGRSTCARTIAQFDSEQSEWGRFAIFAEDGRLLCASPKFRPEAPGAASADDDFDAHITPEGDGLRLSVPGIAGTGQVVAEFPREAIVEMTRPREATGAYQVRLIEGTRSMLVASVGRAGALDEQIVGSAPAFDEQLRLELIVSSPPIRPIELVLMILPILMWLSAGLIGWIVVNSFILRPLRQLQRAVNAYQPGDASVATPAAWTPSVEILELAQAFSHLTATVARHEAELEAGLARQTRLTREVHHRVKNNLQVVASLIHLHARGALSEETAEAYASILRRVDALAIVHRNHYAALDESRGVAVRGLLGELAANLRATAGPRHSRMSIQAEIDTLHASQDNAVAIAFLFTEAAELAMLIDPAAAIRIQMHQIGPARALLTMSSPALRPSEALHDYLGERFGRVFEGLSRQLRSKLQRDEEAGSFAVEVGVID
ncbi:sensor histidine kinase [Sphingomonas sp. ID0503]|uniref:sensor histidine kinase n=1 Tax=Sphingomonas sp. ID0503 TaxID=3399691 RepID=UPI003AFAC683